MQQTARRCWDKEKEKKEGWKLSIKSYQREGKKLRKMMVKEYKVLR